MKTHPLIMILGVVLLVFAGSGSAAEGKRPDLGRAVSASQVTPPAADARRLRDEVQQRGAVGATVQDRRAYGRLDGGVSKFSDGSCDCTRDDDDSPWVCNPPGCMKPVDSPLLEAPRSIEQRTLPQDRVMPQRDMTPRTTVAPRDLPREMQEQRGTRRPLD